MLFKASSRIPLDYGASVTALVLENLSGVAITGEFAWTIADEGRTLECLKRSGDGYVLQEQVVLDALLADIPGLDKKTELDLESIEIADGNLWLCGSHCRVRRQPGKDGVINPKIRDRPSRHFLAAITIDGAGEQLGHGQALPFEGAGSLRHALKDDPYLRAFLDLPSKENGLDIEGLAVVDGKSVLLGLRGPLIESKAVVVQLNLTQRLSIESYKLSFLELGGLAIRDLARDGAKIWVLAGPVDDAPGPFKLYSWAPDAANAVQKPAELLVWDAKGEKPEGICALSRNGIPGMLVVYDRPNAVARLRGTVYEADWMPMTAG
jgi:hypothetical protein